MHIPRAQDPVKQCATSNLRPHRTPTLPLAGRSSLRLSPPRLGRPARDAANARSYRSNVQEVPVDDYTLPLGSAEVLVEGSHVTVVARRLIH